jgi:hypothetical protein
VVRHKPTCQTADEAFRSFVDELAAAAAELLARMKVGHRRWREQTLPASS